jgi:hypothetical protein
VEADNPQVHDPNLIFVGQTISIGGTQASSTDGDGDHDGDTSDASPSAVYSPPAQHRVSVSPSYSGGGLSDVPGVPQEFAACVALRESSNLQDPNAHGNAYGIIPASGYNVNGASLAQQKAVFRELYTQYGTAPWSPSDGCH